MRNGEHSISLLERVSPHRLDGLQFARLVIPTSAGSWRGFRAWAHSDGFPEKGRICYLHDTIFVDMSPEEIETHTKVKQAIHRRVDAVNDDLDLGEFFPDGVLVSDEGAKLSTVPDGSLVKWETSAAGRVRFVPRKDRRGEDVEALATHVFHHRLEPAPGIDDVGPIVRDACGPQIDKLAKQSLRRG